MESQTSSSLIVISHGRNFILEAPKVKTIIFVLKEKFRKFCLFLSVRFQKTGADSIQYESIPPLVSFITGRAATRVQNGNSFGTSAAWEKAT